MPWFSFSREDKALSALKKKAESDFCLFAFLRMVTAYEV
jgi:hypothetical protein